jgi:hypothetical protein
MEQTIKIFESEKQKFDKIESDLNKKIGNTDYEPTPDPVKGTISIYTDLTNVK